MISNDDFQDRPSSQSPTQPHENIPQHSPANDQHDTTSSRKMSSCSSRSSKTSILQKKSLAIARLEEERKLQEEFLLRKYEEDKKFLEQKYKILQDGEEDSDENPAEDSDTAADWLGTTQLDVTQLTTRIDTNKKRNIENTASRPAKTNVTYSTAEINPTVSQHNMHAAPIMRAVSAPANQRPVEAEESLNATSYFSVVTNGSCRNETKRPPIEKMYLPNNPDAHCAQVNSSGPQINSTVQNTDLEAPTFPRLSYIQPSASQNTSTLNNTELSCNLTQQQINARHSVPRELSNFSGHPEEWPLFLSTYEWSTSVCGFSDSENLIRLQRALKEDALDAVRHLLIHPSCVPAAISTLQMLFGQPEKILISIRHKIKSMAPIDVTRLETFTKFAVNVKGLQACIEASGLHNELNNSTILQELIEKLPPPLQLEWGTVKLNYLKANKTANLIQFSSWIFDYGISASSVSSFKDKSLESRKHRKEHSFTHNNKHTCPICKGDCSNVAACEVFLRADRSKRWNIVRQHSLCKQCLRQHSQTYDCKQTCGTVNCTYKHHSLLHRNEENNNQRQNKSTERTLPEEEENKGENSCSHNSVSKQNRNILFRISPVTIFGNDNTEIETFAFIDEGSSITLMDEEIASKLKLNGNSEPLCLKWTGRMHRYENASSRVSITIRGTNCRKIPISAHTVKDLSLPMQSLDYQECCQRFKHLKNLPIQGYKDAVPRLLVGIDNWKLGLPLAVREGNHSEPVAVRTQLGWQIYGKISESDSENECSSYHICECSITESLKLNTLLKNFYSVDSLGIKFTTTPSVSKEEQRAIEMLEENTRLNEDNHFETCLLWRYDTISLPDSFNMAKKRLMCLERKFAKEPTLRQMFEEKIEDYKAKGYIRRLSFGEISNSNYPVWYLPIFAVYNKNKPGKFRVVWDAAAKSHGVSLNSFLLKGPDMLTSLPGVLHRFRQRKVAVSADIAEMFHQIHIRSCDQNAQRFLWRDKETDTEPATYAMNVMTFGAASSPCTAQFVKNTNAKRFENTYPVAYNGIVNNHYVDDYLESVDTTCEALKLAKDIIYIHAQGGFVIRNWCSNVYEIYHALNPDPVNRTISISGSTNVEKILGVYWISDEDVITFKLSTAIWESEILRGKETLTKRQMLSIVMSIFDPLGLINNILIAGKILLQEVWRSNLAWDDKLLQIHMTSWVEWTKCLLHLQNLKIPRCYLKLHVNYDNTNIQLHTFVDASENAYAAVCYIRVTSKDSVECSLIGSKARVAPLKPLSIPRLELMAALIGARYAKYITDSHSIRFDQKVFWSDSKTVLAWLRSDARKYHQFVALRVSEILDLTDVNEWRWIESRMNVADEATKRHKITDSIHNSRWLNGPNFLYSSVSEWPKEELRITTTDTEKKLHVLSIINHEPLINTSIFSKWNKLLRTVAYVVRFANNCKRKIYKQTPSAGELNQSEIMKAQTTLYRIAQNEAFADEIVRLKDGKLPPKSSVIHKLSGYLDEDNVLRINSRLNYSCLPSFHEPPVILPKNSWITHLIIQHFHSKLHHLNFETTVNELRQHYHITRMRATVKSVIAKCQTCKIYKATSIPPQMAKLPHARQAAYTAPFTFTGVDFFGPIYVTVNRHKEKRYGVLFTCLTIRAVHIEIAYSLNTSSCIMAVKNFISRRGTPREFFSDNATNFVATEKELLSAYREIDKDEILREYTTSFTKWNFNPPASPHMGGAWERLVRSVKTVLYKIMPSRTPGDELLRSMMAEVENIINSRPLTYMPVESEQAEALTPNHFLLGSSNGLKPTALYDNFSTTLKENWLISQQYAQHFWHRWVQEYMPTLTRRTKWHQKVKPLCVGDLVVVVDPESPRNVWLRGKILETKTATDGQVRSAKVLTTRGILERPAVKLAKLDVAE